MKPCLGATGTFHPPSSMGLAESPGFAQRRMRFPSRSPSGCLGQLRPWAEAGREWLRATVSYRPWGGGVGRNPPCPAL